MVATEHEELTGRLRGEARGDVGIRAEQVSHLLDRAVLGDLTDEPRPDVVATAIAEVADQAMALVDAIRGGRARERTMGASLLEEVIGANRE